MSPRTNSFTSICIDDDISGWKDDNSSCDSSTIETATYQMNKMKLGEPTSSSLSSKSTRGNKKGSNTKILRFAAEDEILLIRHIDDFTDEEISAIWFDQQYYADIKTEYKNVVFAIERGRHVESDDETSRGLEHRTQEGSWARFQIKRDSYNAVLDEQDRQWKENADDDMKISQIYITHSHKCARKAYQMGLMDEIAARKMYAEAMISSPLLKSYNRRPSVSSSASVSSSPGLLSVPPANAVISPLKAARKNSMSNARTSSPTSVIPSPTESTSAYSPYRKS